jgi:hypothetical protein
MGHICICIYPHLVKVFLDLFHHAYFFHGMREIKFYNAGLFSILFNKIGYNQGEYFIYHHLNQFQIIF